MYRIKHLFFGLNILLCLFIFLFSGSTSIIISLVFFYITTSILILIFSKKNKNQFNDLILVFNISFFSYVLLSVLAYLTFLEINDFFIYSDQLEFFEIGDELGKLSSIKEIFIKCFIDRIHFVNEGALFYFGFLAYLANLFDGNSLFYQILNVSFFGTLINIFIYKILLFYTNINSAFKYTVYYALFSFIPVFSVWLLRDIHIALFFSIAIYLTHLQFKIKNVFILFLLSLIVLEFRFTTGIAFLFFPLFYIYSGISKSKYKLIYYILIISIFILIINKFSQNLFFAFNTLVEGFIHYSEYSIEVVNEQGGLGGLLLNLPIVIKQLSILVYSQISPFPIWDQFVKSNTLIQYIFGFIFMISPIYWGFVFYFVIVNLVSKINNLNNFQIVLFLFFIIFLLGNSSNLNLRRIVAVYPLLYCIFVLFITRSSKTIIKFHIYRYIYIYILFVIIYILLKYFIL